MDGAERAGHFRRPTACCRWRFTACCALTSCCLPAAYVFQFCAVRLSLSALFTAAQAGLHHCAGLRPFAWQRGVPALAGRIQRAWKVYRRQVKRGKAACAVMSGGRRRMKPCRRPQAMKAYAVRLGVPEQDVLTESASKNTWGKHAVSPPQTTCVPRRAVCQTGGLPAQGIGAKTKFYYWYNAVLREYLAVLSCIKGERRVHCHSAFYWPVPGIFCLFYPGRHGLAGRGLASRLTRRPAGVQKEGVCIDLEGCGRKGGGNPFHRFPRHCLQQRKVRQRRSKNGIWKAVQETGYRPNQSAQALRKGRTWPERARGLYLLFVARSKDFAKRPLF